MLAVVIENKNFEAETILFPYSADGQTIKQTIAVLYPGYKWIETIEERTAL
jgi:hypothetical protein